jgi:hypothetical protein
LSPVTDEPPMVPDEQQARDIAVRLAGREGADALLEAARTQVARLVAEPAFLADVERVACELLRRRELTGDDINEFLKGERLHG